MNGSANPFQGFYDRWGKRTVDCVIASSLLVGLSPVLMGVVLVLRLVGQERVLFSQERIGFRNRVFRMYKFATMTDECDAAGIPLPDEKRITPVGAWLRRTSLDELPELVNVLRGDMSLVGPRPLLAEYLSLYSAKQIRRHHVRPGITGWAQVNGRNTVSWGERFRLDVWYTENLGFLTDIRILWMTVKKVVSQTDIHSDGHATMPKFTGSGGPAESSQDVLS